MIMSADGLFAAEETLLLSDVLGTLLLGADLESEV